jgi:hypothetical protein
MGRVAAILGGFAGNILIVCDSHHGRQSCGASFLATAGFQKQMQGQEECSREQAPSHNDAVLISRGSQLAGEAVFGTDTSAVWNAGQLC